MSETKAFSSTDLQHWITSVLQKSGLRAEDANIAADTLVSTSLRGVDTHGVLYTQRTVWRVLNGEANPTPNVRVVQEGPATALMDADNGLGIVASVSAMRKAIEKARDSGVGVVGVRNSKHFGAAAHYALLAAGEGMIGLSATNVEPVMAPWGSRSLYLGNNPFAIAAPGGIAGGVVLDIATSQVA